MKKILFALLLSLGLAQVAPIIAGDETTASSKLSYIKNHKKALMVGLAVIAVAAVAGDVLAYNTGHDFGLNKTALDKISAVGEQVVNFLNPKGSKKFMALEAIAGVGILFVLADIGNTLILKRPELANSFIKFAGKGLSKAGAKAKSMVAKKAAK